MKVNALVAQRLEQFRKQRGLSRAQLEELSLLGDGWLELIESGAFPISVDFLSVLLHHIGVSVEDFFATSDIDSIEVEFDRRLSIISHDLGVVLHFPYGDHDATYLMARAKMDEVQEWFVVFRNGLRGSKSDAVTAAFLDSVRRWPQVNPADLWNFLIHQAYCDFLNHPPSEARRDFEQSWKRTAGWALERVLVDFYEPYLSKYGVHLEIATGARRAELVGQLVIDGRVEADKIDVFMLGDGASNDRTVFGAVHVKASFAERRTDDVPLSQALIRGGYASPLVTLDCKATPSATPFNRGELGELLGELRDSRSAKRKDIEEDGYFSACFSYNHNTKPTPEAQDAAARVYACTFENPDDSFGHWTIERWQKYQQRIR